MKREPFGLVRPCAKCPFRTDIPAYLRPARVRDIQRSLIRSVFPCHETTRHADDTGALVATDEELHCAGALILLEKQDPPQPSQMMRIGERLGLYDRDKLDMSAPVYNNFDELYAACRAVPRQ